MEMLKSPSKMKKMKDNIGTILEIIIVSSDEEMSVKNSDDVITE
jgi:hypothetical protein